MCACAHFVRLPPFLPANFNEQAGRSQGFHNHVCDPRDTRETENCRNTAIVVRVSELTLVLLLMV